jgi:hypothetical protein
MDFTLGISYSIPCALLRWRDDGQLYHVPVFDHFHADPQFGFRHKHYHIDGRFDFHPRVKHFFELTEGKTLSVITRTSKAYELLKIESCLLLCVRNETGLNFANASKNISKYKNWYAGFVGQECKGKRCPHYGTEMLEQNGKLVCPMHNLIADAKTLLIIPAH